ncbi:hypothetical protein ACS0TY_016131 [Phlomoides rotata]
MKTLSGSYCKFSTEKTTAFRCSTEVALSRREIGFLVRQKRVRNGFSPAVSFQLKRVRPISAVSSSAQTGVDSEEIQIISSDEPKSVRVRIKLLKECTFGEQFLVVGDDPVLGLWDPYEGVPLDWSEGHVWTAEVDIPIGKVIKYKFIHKGISGAMLWQPGTDRVLQTWATERIISVSEDWENPGLQNVVEEDFVDVLNEASLIDSNLGQTLVEEGDNAVDKLEELSSSDKGSAIVSEKGEETSDLSSLKDETKLVLDEGVPVLVLGLVSASTDEVKNSVVENTIIEPDEVEESAESEQQNGEEATAELNGVCVPSASLHSTETGEMMVDEEQQYGKEEMESNIMESDVQWGRRTLQKFLANLGFI